MADERMPLGQWAMIWQVSEDRRTVRALLPPLRIPGATKPLSIYYDMDAEAVDDLQRRLAEIRAQMLPAPKRN
jgi:hypothetical protein